MTSQDMSRPPYRRFLIVSALAGGILLSSAIFTWRLALADRIAEDTRAASAAVEILRRVNETRFKDINDALRRFDLRWSPGCLRQRTCEADAGFCFRDFPALEKLLWIPASGESTVALSRAGVAGSVLRYEVDPPDLRRMRDLVDARGAVARKFTKLWEVPGDRPMLFFATREAIDRPWMVAIIDPLHLLQPSIEQLGSDWTSSASLDSHPIVDTGVAAPHAAQAERNVTFGGTIWTFRTASARPPVKWLRLSDWILGSGIVISSCVGLIVFLWQFGWDRFQQNRLLSLSLERKVLERTAALTEQFRHQAGVLQSVLDSMGDGVAVAGVNGQFLMVNPAAMKVLHVPSFGGENERGERGMFRPDTFTPYLPEHLPFARAIRGEAVDNLEIILKADGAADPRWMSVSARPLRDQGAENGEIRGAVLVIRDITEAKYAAEALELSRKEAETANRAKSEFLSRMSHELRTPLNSILGFAQLLEMHDLNEQGMDNVCQILKGGYHLLDLINEILDFAKLDSGRLTVTAEPVIMRDALKEALDLVRPLAADRKVTIRAEDALRCRRYVQADHQRLRQVFFNLLSNAVQFNREHGSVVVSCNWTPNGTLRIELADTGFGIAPENMKKLFRPFERLDADRTESRGMGLGLVLSKRLVEAMGGSMGAESQVGLGSRFYFELPLSDESVEGPAGEQRPQASFDTPLPSLAITALCIEDDPLNLRLIERIFARRPGIRLLSAAEGRLGLDLAELYHPAWILLHLHLPDIEGEEVLRRLRANPGTGHIPVTILSADDNPARIRRLIEAGARDYLTKPLHVRKLIHLIDKTIAAGASRAPERGTLAERNH
jgi:PAS domain S-box-containing protein